MTGWRSIDDFLEALEDEAGQRDEQRAEKYRQGAEALEAERREREDEIERREREATGND